MLTQHVRDVVPLLLSRVVGEHGEKVEHDTAFERHARHSPGPFPGKPLEVLVEISLGLLLDDLVPGVPRVVRQKVRI